MSDWLSSFSRRNDHENHEKWRNFPGCHWSHHVTSLIFRSTTEGSQHVEPTRGPPSEIEPHHPQVPQSKLGQLLRAALHVLKDRAAESTLNHLPHGSADRGSSDVIGIEVFKKGDYDTWWVLFPTWKIAQPTHYTHYIFQFCKLFSDFSVQFQWL